MVSPHSKMSQLMAENDKIREMRSRHFSRLADQVYLDHAGAALYPDGILVNYIRDLTSSVYGNPHSGSLSGQSSQEISDKVRVNILHYFNTNIQDYTVVFTSGATASMKLLAESFQFSPLAIEDNVNGQCNQMRNGGFYFLNDNHTSVLGMREIAREKGAHTECLTENSFPKTRVSRGNNLFAFPAQSNFCGRRYPLDWTEKFQNLSTEDEQCYVLLDAASYVSSTPLDLRKCKPDFVAISFYKMFGFPTGLGALLVRNNSESVLKKTYFGGGTLDVGIAEENYHVFRKSLSERFEDGTVNYLDIIALKHAFSIHSDITEPLGSLDAFLLTNLVYHYLTDRRHGNGQPIAICYVDDKDNFADHNKQGPIIAFNLFGKEGDYIGFSEVSKLAALSNIHLRTGCFCNLGDCQKHLGMSADEVKKNFQGGHSCGDDMDLVDGRPTGALRVSLGYYTNIEDIKAFFVFIEDCFVEGCKMNKREINEYTDRTLARLTQGQQQKSDVNNALLQNDNVKYDTNDKTCFRSLFSGVSLVPNTVEKTGIYLDKICVYPIKSCGAFVTDTWEVGPKGLVYDREWMIVDDTGTGIKQGKYPQMALIQPHIDLTRGFLKLEYPGSGPVITPLEMPDQEKGSPLRVKYFSRSICRDMIESTVCDGNVSKWLCHVLGTSGLHLVRQSGSNDRCIKLKNPGESDISGSMSLANEAQYLLISNASVKAFHEQMNERCQSGEIDAANVPEFGNLRNRFRANLVVDGELEAYSENQWEAVSIGRSHFNVQGLCKRCQMICTDQEKGTRNKEVYKTLSLVTKRNARFGVLINRVDCTRNARISVGDKMCVLNYRK